MKRAAQQAQKKRSACRPSSCRVSGIVQHNLFGGREYIVVLEDFGIAFSVPLTLDLSDENWHEVVASAAQSEM